MNKKGQTQLLLVLLVGVVVYFVATSGVLKGVPQSVTGKDTDVKTTIDVCESSTAPSLTFSGANKFTGASLAGSCQYKKNGGNINSATLGTAITAVSVGDEIEYSCGAVSYHNVSGSLTVPCSTAVAEDVKLVAHDSSVATRVLNEDDGDANSQTNNQSVVAGGSYSLDMRTTASNDQGDDLLIFCSYNSNDYEKPDSSLSEVDEPAYFSSNSSYKTVAWDIGKLEDNEKLDWVFSLEMKDGATSARPIDCEYADRDWYLNEKTGTFEYGTSDENDNNIASQTKHGFQIYSII